MDVSEYRKRVEAEIAKRGQAATARPAAERARDLASSKGADLDTRVDALRRLPLDRENAGASCDLLLGVLRDRDEPSAVRKAALRALKAAAFLGPLFDPCREEFLRTLYGVATEPGTDSELREESFEVLAISKVEEALQLLLRGLEDPARALVRPAKAIQFLAYDVHGRAAAVVRRLFDKITDISAKAEALRLLASDPASEGLFARLLKDKSQSPTLRALSATGLKLLNLETFENTVRELVKDKDEDDNLRATFLSALTHLRDRRSAQDDPDFVQDVRELARSGPERLRASARRFIDRFGR
jgi:hypothetical protein